MVAAPHRRRRGLAALAHGYAAAMPPPHMPPDLAAASANLGAQLQERPFDEPPGTRGGPTPNYVPPEHMGGPTAADGTPMPGMPPAMPPVGPDGGPSHDLSAAKMAPPPMPPMQQPPPMPPMQQPPAPVPPTQPPGLAAGSMARLGLSLLKKKKPMLQKPLPVPGFGGPAL